MAMENFNTQIFGEDALPKAVFLHGVLGQGKNWRSYARRFSKKIQTLLYDQRGHGESFQPAQGYDLTHFSQDLKSLLDELDWREPINLLGHSMGGRVALRFATDFPERVGRLVIVDIGPSSDWASMQRIIDRIDQVPVPFETQEDAKAYFSGPYKEQHGETMANFFFTNIRQTPENKWNWGFYSPGIRQFLENSRVQDYWDLFLGLECPTLLIRGGNSTDLTKEDFQKITANNSNITGLEIPEAGHWVHVDQPAQTRKALEEFFMIATTVG